jgi:hypothetical protein
MRFDEHEAIERSFEDAIAELRYDHYEESGSRQSKNESDTVEEDKSETITKGDSYSEGTTGYERPCLQFVFLLLGRGCYLYTIILQTFTARSPY